MKTLETMRNSLKEFIAFDANNMRDVYIEEFGWGSEDYDADIEKATDLLEQVEWRMKSLGHYLATKGDKNASQSPLPHAAA